MFFPFSFTYLFLSGEKHTVVDPSDRNIIGIAILHIAYNGRKWFLLSEIVASVHLPPLNGTKESNLTTFPLSIHLSGLNSSGSSKCLRSLKDKIGKALITDNSIFCGIAMEYLDMLNKNAFQ